MIVNTWFIQTALTAFVVSFGLSYTLTFVVRKLAIRYGFVDQPTRGHPGILHSRPIPRAGGVAIFIAFLAAALIWVEIDPFVIGIIVGGGINVLVGTLDDKLELSPRSRLIVQIISGLAVVLSGVAIYTSNPFGEGILYFDLYTLNLPQLAGLDNLLVLPADLVLIFWIVLLMNTANWAKGASQLPGVAVIAFLTLAGVALKYQTGNPYQVQTALLAIISAGAVLAFLPFNFPPEKMFPGFGASTWIGFNLAVLAVLSGGKVATVLIVLLIPVIDAVMVGLKRLATGHSPFTHDREHLYHFMLNVGLSKRQVIYFYWATAALFGLSALLLQTKGKLIAITSLTTLIAIFFVYLYLRHRE